MLGVYLSSLLGSASASASKDLNCPPNPSPLRSKPGAPDIPSPSYNQLNWLKNEMDLFIHFGVNTYTDREWGTGDEDPNIFQPAKLNTTQWVETALAGGFKSIILVTKHHDGFFLFPNKFTTHTVASSSWRGGKGDVVADFVKSCADLQMKASFYLSPWDRNYFNMTWKPSYNQFYLDTMQVLTKNYGRFEQLWWDGANAVPNSTGYYDWQTWYSTLKKDQPYAVGGGCGGEHKERDCGPDSVWIGNEDGLGSETSWSFSPASVRFPTEDPEDLVYGPPFCDVSIRNGWFWHPKDVVKTPAQLWEIYLRTVGRGCIWQLNIPPNRDGLFDSVDVEYVRTFGNYMRKVFATDYALNGKATASSEMCGSSGQNVVDGNPDTYWIPDMGVHLATLEVQLLKPATVNLVVLQEHINHGHVISGYTVEVKGSKDWVQVSKGTTIGSKKIDRFDAQTVTAVRFTITSTLYDYPFALQTLSLAYAPPMDV